MDVYFISKILNDTKIVVPAQKMDHLPQFNDYVDVGTYLEGTELEIFTDYINANNKIMLGKVIARTWGKKNGVNILFVGLNFENPKDENGEIEAEWN